MSKLKQFYLIGYASDIAGAKGDAALGPAVIKKSLASIDEGKHFDWLDTFENKSDSNVNEALANTCTALANLTSIAIKQKLPFCVIGGDHTAAIGTWSGVNHALQDCGDIGLIWIDAHMDSHTPDTTESGHIHGMPLACLLGYGAPILTQILTPWPKIKPDNVCLIGVRSYEAGEAALLGKLGVKIYFMEEVRMRGFKAVFDEALSIVNQKTIGYGISFDLDALDPVDAPAVDVPEPNGIRFHELIAAFEGIHEDTRLLATEIVEFDPNKDIDKRTETIIIKLLKTFSG